MEDRSNGVGGGGVIESGGGDDNSKGEGGCNGKVCATSTKGGIRDIAISLGAVDSVGMGG